MRESRSRIAPRVALARSSSSATRDRTAGGEAPHVTSDALVGRARARRARGGHERVIRRKPALEANGRSASEPISRVTELAPKPARGRDTPAHPKQHRDGSPAGNAPPPTTTTAPPSNPPRQPRFRTTAARAAATTDAKGHRPGCGGRRGAAGGDPGGALRSQPHQSPPPGGAEVGQRPHPTARGGRVLRLPQQPDALAVVLKRGARFLADATRRRGRQADPQFLRMGSARTPRARRPKRCAREACRPCSSRSCIRRRDCRTPRSRSSFEDWRRHSADSACVRPDAEGSADCSHEEGRKCRPSRKRLKGFEPSTFCMASRT